MRWSQPKNRFGQGGSMGGHETYIFGQILDVIHQLSKFGTDVCEFQVKESIYRSFEKIGPLVLAKMAVLCQIQVRHSLDKASINTIFEDISVTERIVSVFQKLW